MPLTEFQLIEKYFARTLVHRDDVVLGIGDDCALVKCPPGHTLAVTTDTLTEAVHFSAGTSPQNVGYKSLAVNLSDLAAMGAIPAWATLALTLPRLEETWVAGFCDGFFELAGQFDVQLIGGDITRGPLSITVQVHGLVPEGKALTRRGAQPADVICVTGEIGAAGIGLLHVLQKLKLPSTDRLELEHCIDRLHKPRPRIELGQALTGLANACIDISDGLAADLDHILTASGMGAVLTVDQVPVPACFEAVRQQIGGWQYPLTCGDDYELCFTVPPTHMEEVNALADRLGCRITPVGVIQSSPGLRFMLEGQEIKLEKLGYDHFKQ